MSEAFWIGAASAFAFMAVALVLALGFIRRSERLQNIENRLDQYSFQRDRFVSDWRFKTLEKTVWDHLDKHHPSDCEECKRGEAKA